MENVTTVSTSVVIVDDQEIVRIGLKVLIDRSQGLNVVGLAQDGREAILMVEKLQPDVVIMDIGLPLVDGIEATRLIKEQWQSVRVIMLTSHDDDRHIFAALGAGADGYCLKETPGLQLVMAVRSVAEGAAWLDPGIAMRVLKASTRGAETTFAEPDASSIASTLTKRELEVLKLVVNGNSNQEIADKLVLSVETVKTHMRHIMEKLRVSDRTQAAVKAMREGLF
ncbi:MAG: response regulator transcription factor [Candidatus Obscuribacterales bacterium]|nr:response regulator transcription factor [Candidatus Obscuribacterales bacterium]